LEGVVRPPHGRSTSRIVLHGRSVAFFLDLVNWRRLPLNLLLISAALAGATGVVLFLVTHGRHFRFIPVLLALMGASIYTMGFLPHGPQILISGTARSRIILDATGILAGMLLGYRCFLWFINTQGIEQVRTRTKLELAHGIQQTLVPPITYRSASLEVYGITLPSEDVGGDLVDLIPAESGCLACLGDVSGHGIPAGVLMGNLKTVLRFGFAQNEALPALFESINRVLPAVKEPEMYATFAGLHLGGAGAVEYILAGHPPILHYRAACNQVSRRIMEQFPLGLMPESSYVSATTSCQQEMYSCW
jgi:hypothetical protein